MRNPTLEEIKRRLQQHRELAGSVGPWLGDRLYYQALRASVADRDALVAEIERLRARKKSLAEFA